MLNKLIIKNVALIEYAEIEFGKGLNVLSGETGAGKSVILDSINFVLGAKADKTMIRNGESSCSVCATFIPENNDAVFEILKELDIDADDEIIILRKYSLDGKGSIKVNGLPVNTSMLRKITSNLVDVHGQSEHFYLLSEANQLALLDKVAGESVTNKKRELLTLLMNKKEIVNRLAALGGDDASRDRRIDLLQYQINEIKQANLQDGEEERLAAKKILFANIEKIVRCLSDAIDYLHSDGAAIDALISARRLLTEISNLNPEYAALESRLESLTVEAEDVSSCLSALLESLSYNEFEANEVERRLDEIKSLKRKYGNTVFQVLDYLQKIEDEYSLLSHCEEEFSKLSASLESTMSDIFHTCEEITSLRENAARSFCERVSEELRSLNIQNANFYVAFSRYTFEDANLASQEGLDKIKFMFSANAGEPAKPLNKVISGGEMSRLMLAIKTQMSDLNGISTYIFDEIDAGISGNTARTVAEKFAKIAKEKQILAVSHLAQIVAMGDYNYLIVKNEIENEKTVTNIYFLEEKDRLREIIRLLGGDVSSVAAQTLAKELLESCNKYKKVC